MAKRSPFQLMTEYLSNNYKFVYNVVLNKVAKVHPKTKQLSYLGEYELNTLWTELLLSRMDISKNMLMSYLCSEMTPKIDPFKDYFNTLPAWTPDQPDYIQMLADTITVPQEEREQWNLYLKRWLMGAVACATNPEATNQQVLVLVGKQGIGKTKWTERLLPNKLRGYSFSGTVNPDNKDSSINLSECFLINLDELGNLNKGDLNSLKQLITMSSVRLRRPYAAMSETMPRRASFVGSVNSTEFLRDDTGNRRYLCVDAQEINYEHTVDMDLVYAQAVYLLNKGDRYWFVGEEITAINKSNEKYRVQQIELEYVNEHFEPCLAGETPDMELTTSGIQSYLLRQRVNILNLNAIRLGKALMASDYAKVRVKKNGGLYYRLKLKDKPKLAAA